MKISYEFWVTQVENFVISFGNILKINGFSFLKSKIGHYQGVVCPES